MSPHSFSHILLYVNFFLSNFCELISSLEAKRSTKGGLALRKASRPCLLPLSEGRSQKRVLGNKVAEQSKRVPQQALQSRGHSLCLYEGR